MESRPTFWERTRLLQIGILVAVVFTVGFMFGTQFSVSRAQGITLPEDAQPAFEALFQAYNLIDQQYIEDIEVETLVDGAITGMVEALDDQYSSYVEPELFPYVDSRLSGQIEGIGAVISLIEATGEIEIVNVLSGTPAEAAGLQPGDIFVTVNGEDVSGMNTLQVASRVRGPVGTTVELEMRRGDEILFFSIVRARIEIRAVEYEMLDGNIFYIRLSDFSANARTEIDQALATIDVSGLNGLILDLRGNPGGFLSTATEIAGLFMQSGVVLYEQFGDGEERIFKIQDNRVIQIFDDGSEQVYSSNAAYAGITAPIVVLVDERSASASELVAGAWQDNGVATLIGVTTFGKGTVQVQNTLTNGGGLRLTIARWLTPNRNWITDVGITPDMVVEMPEEVAEGEDPQLQAAIDFITSAVPVSP